MNELLSIALQAHGGLERWSRLRHITVAMSVGGPFWAAIGQPELLGDELVEIDPIHQHTRLIRASAGGRSIEYDNRNRHVRVKAGNGAVIADAQDPRASMAGFERCTKWGIAQAAYFICYASWHDLTEPFLFTYHGVETHEIEPWVERGEIWRRLRVIFPDSIASHSKEQTFYFDAGGLLRRLDYEPVVNGSPAVAHYTDDHRTFGGIVFPTKRRVRQRNRDNTANFDVAAITLDLRDVKVDAFY